MKSMIMSNKDFQALGRTSRVVATYLLDDDGNRLRKISNEFHGYSGNEVEVVKTSVDKIEDLELKLGISPF